MSDRPGQYRYVRGRMVDPETGRPTGEGEIPVAETLETEAAADSQREANSQPATPPAAPGEWTPLHIDSSTPRRRASTQRILWIGTGAVAAVAGMIVLGIRSPERAPEAQAVLIPVVERATAPSTSPAPVATQEREVEALAAIRFTQSDESRPPTPASEVAASGQVTLPAAMAPDLPAITVPTVEIAINATPWAMIEIDGEPVGETPLSKVSLPVGRHRFVARMPDGSVRERVTHIASDNDSVIFR